MIFNSSVVVLITQWNIEVNIQILTVNYDYVSLLKNLFGSDILLQPRTGDRKWQRSNNLFYQIGHIMCRIGFLLFLYFFLCETISLLFFFSRFMHTRTQKKIQLLPTICFLLSNKRFFTVCNHAVFPNIDSMAITVCITW